MIRIDGNVLPIYRRVWGHFADALFADFEDVGIKYRRRRAKFLMFWHIWNMYNCERFCDGADYIHVFVQF